MPRTGLAIALATLALAAPASAATIYYGCPAGICRIAPDGTHQQTVASGSYRSPSVSLDGGHLAWIQPTADLFSGDGSAGNPVGPISRYAIYAELSGDGSEILTFENAGQGARVCIYPVGGGSCASQAGGGTGGWAAGNRVLLTTYDFNDPALAAHNASYDNKVCLLKPGGGETGGECEQTYVYDADFVLSYPTLSPDGSTVAVERAPWDDPKATQIALYDVGATSPKSVLTQTGGATTPQWSPDGSMIAFARDGGIWVTDAGAVPGAERRLADGDSPSWADVSSGGGAGAPKLAAKRTQHGTTVHGSVVVPAAGTRVVIQLVAQGYLVGQRVIGSAAAGRRAFAVRLAAKLVRALRAKHVHRLTVTLAVNVGGTVLKRKVTLRL